jgi:hypothetical protein
VGADAKATIGATLLLGCPGPNSVPGEAARKTQEFDETMPMLLIVDGHTSVMESRTTLL